MRAAPPRPQRRLPLFAAGVALLAAGIAIGVVAARRLGTEAPPPVAEPANRPVPKIQEAYSEPAPDPDALPPEAEQHPEDRRRNLDAAAVFDRLADDMRAGRWNMGIFFAFGRLSYEASDDDMPRRVEIESELLREVGFSFHPTNADDFMREAIARFEREAAL